MKFENASMLLPLAALFEPLNFLEVHLPNGTSSTQPPTFIDMPSPTEEADNVSTNYFPTAIGALLTEFYSLLDLAGYLLSPTNPPNENNPYYESSVPAIRHPPHTDLPSP
jgi:hypothetical protein